VRFTPQDEEFRADVRAWLAANLSGPFGALRGAGGPGREHERHAERLAWNRHLATAGWTCLGWPADFGGRGATLAQQVIFHEEYARAGAPALVSIVGEELLGPTLIAFGTPEQQARFLPPIKQVTELWCQGYSEPGAGSDLANVATKAARDGPEWVITGQKVWTSLAHVADWCFVLARTEPGSRGGAGLSYLIGLEAVRAYALDTLGGDDATEASVLKILWSRWHRDLGELAMEVLGAPSMVARGEPYDLDEWQRLFLFSRADRIYGGSDEIQRNIIATRALGLPRQERP
jgi:alkylation response protein AidB-like acyl-CoA dehydrogenase